MSRLFDIEDEPEPEPPGLPPLRGTENQIPWAAHVRAKKINEVDRLIFDWQEYVRRLESAGKTAAAARERKALTAALDAAERLREQDTCNWWLNRRANSARDLVSGAPAKPGATWTKGE